MTITLRDSSSILRFFLLCLKRKITTTHKKKLNSVCTGLMFTLALPAVFAPVGFPSTLSCNVALKPTICDMLLNHEKLGTDTLLPTPSEFREYSLGSLGAHRFCVLISVFRNFCHHPRVWKKFLEFADCPKTPTIRITKICFHLPWVHVWLTF